MVSKIHHAKWQFIASWSKICNFIIDGTLENIFASLIFEFLIVDMLVRSFWNKIFFVSQSYVTKYL